MNEQKWEKFFDLIKEIVDSEGSFEEKKKQIIEQADLKYRTTELDEFLSWFDGLLGDV